jgi:hypothetical protein
MENFSRIYARFATGFGFDDLPPEVIFHAKKSILGLIGLALAGFVTELGRIANNRVTEWNPS